MAKLQIKKSNETGKVPQPSDLDWGELALNYTDGKLFYKKHGTNTVELLTSVTRLRGTTSGTYTSGDLTLVAGTNITITQSGSDYTIASAGGADSTKLPLTGGTLTGTLNFNSADQSAILQHDGTAIAWYGRLLVKNATADISSFLGNYNSKAGVFAHNNALTAWAPLYVNTLGNNGGGTVYLPHNATYTLSGDNTAYAILNAGNYNSYALPLTGGTLTGALSVALDASIYGITVGRGAGAVATNTALGADALAANTTGNNNTATGYGVMYHNTSGASNVANGVDALFYNQTGSNNVAVGRSALQSNTTASFNTAVGHQAAYSNTTGGAVDAFGYQAAYSNTTGAAIQAFGLQALKSNTTGSYNVAFGQYALYSNTTASYNTAVGYQAAYGNTTGQQNVAIGYQSLFSNTTGQLNVAIGAYALLSQNADAYNTAVGANSMQSTTSGSLNAAFGRLSLYANTTGSYNTGVGYQALNSNTTASYNTAVGYQSGYSQTTGGNNTSFGATSLYTTTTGTLNTAIGQSSLFSNTTGSNNTVLGLQALFSNTTASNNTAVGYQAGYTGSGTYSQYNTFVGYQAGYTANPSSSSAYGNVCIGAATGFSLTTGYANTFVGSIGSGGASPAGYSVTTGIGNAFFGTGSGNAVTTGSKNTIIGGYTGNQGGLDIRTASNYIVLSDGDGNPRIVVDGSGNTSLANLTAGAISASNITITGELRGPATMYIDPAAVGDNTGTLVIRGNLQVDGTTTTINSTTVAIDDLNIQLAADAPNAAAANGAGISVAGAGATFTYASSGDKWQLNKPLEINSDDGVKAVYGGTDGQTWLRGWGLESDRGAVYIRGTGNASQTLRIGYSEGSLNWATVRVDTTTFTHNGNTIWTAGNDGSGSGLDADLLDGLDSSSYWTKSGSWWGAGFAGSRLQGVSANGGEFVLIQDHPNTGQISVLVDGAYIAGENNGFWMTPGNNWNTRYGFYWNGSQIDFRQGTAPVVFGGFVGIGGSFGSDDGNWGARLNVGGAPHARIDVRCSNDGIITTMFSHQGQNSGKMGTMSDHRLALMANGSEYISVLTNGNVGIGVNAPSSGDKVEIVGALRIHTSNNWDAIKIYTDGANGYIQGLGDETGLRIRSEYGNILLADNRGNVGIGTASPSWLLTAYAPSVPQFALQNATRSFILTNNSGDNLLSFNYGGVNRLQFDTTNQWINSGNLGIGFSPGTNPSYKLHVTGDIYANGGWLRVSGNQGLYFETWAGGWYMQDSTWIRTYNEKSVYTGSGVLGTNSGGVSSGYGGASPPSGGAIISGNTGIGTQTPQYKLDVYQSGIAASFGATIGSGQIAGIHFGYSEATNTAYRKSALVFERTDNNNQGGNASGKIHFLLMNGSSTSATSLVHSVVTIDSDANGTIGSVRMGVGTTTPTYTLQVNGSFAATTKSFVINHPTKPGKKLRYGSLEGPENGVYVRGRLRGTKIELPDYWTKLVDPDSITVQLTAHGRRQDIWVTKIADNCVYVQGTTQPDCYYFIQAERVDVEKLQVELDA